MAPFGPKEAPPVSSVLMITQCKMSPNMHIRMCKQYDNLQSPTKAEENLISSTCLHQRQLSCCVALGCL
jgi:hypothetical protein